MIGFENLFVKLTQPTAAGDGVESFSAAPVPGWERYRVVRGIDGCPGLLIQAAADDGEPLPPVELQNLSFRPEVQCRVDSGDGALEGRFALITCKSKERALRQLFLRTLEGWLTALGAAPSLDNVGAAVERLANLFSALNRPGQATVQGLWAEVFLIAESADPALLVTAWHSRPHELFDFGSELQRIEVKSAGQQRCHSFLLDQLRDPSGGRVLVASVLVQETGDGQSLRDLLDELRKGLKGHDELMNRVEAVVAQSLGEAWLSGVRVCFDRRSARNSLAFFWGAQIPKVDPRIPPEVTDVRFECDLSGVPPASVTDLASAGGLFSAVVPLRLATGERQ